MFDELWREYPTTSLKASGQAVGLPDGQMGNSEVGHLNLGAGAVVRQDLVRIDDAIADGRLAENEVLRAAFAGAERVHLLGLVSDGGVHSSLEHLHRFTTPPLADAKQHRNDERRSDPGERRDHPHQDEEDDEGSQGEKNTHVHPTHE